MEPSITNEPPLSAASAGTPGLAGYTRALLLCLVTGQIGYAFLSLPRLLEQTRTGEISLLTFLGALLAMCIFAAGGTLLLARRRSAASLFGIAALLGLIIAIQWRPLFVLTGIAVSITGASVLLFCWRARA